MKRGGRSNAIIVALTALLCVVISIGVGLQGRFLFSGPIFIPNDTGASKTVPPQSATPTTTATASAPLTHNTPVVFPWAVILIVLAAIAVAIILIFTLLWLRNRPRRGLSRGLTTIEFTMDDTEAADPNADLPTLRRGLVRASEILESDREPRDAIVRAWIGLQEAAEDSGIARRPAETPTEFTTRVFESAGVDRVAASTLLKLYLRVRFGTHAATADDVASARGALDALSASWPVRSGG